MYIYARQRRNIDSDYNIAFYSPCFFPDQCDYQSTQINFSDSDMIESPYNHIYGRIPLPTRGYIPAPRTMYIGEWD